MATAPSLYLNLATGTSSRFNSADTQQANTIAAFSATDAVSLFDNLTTGDITIGGAQTADGHITIGTAASDVTILGDLTVNGVETVVTSETVNGSLTVEGATTLGAPADYSDAVTLNGYVTGPSNVIQIGTTGANDHTITTAATGANLTVTAAASRALTLTSPIAATWSTTDGALTLSGAGGITNTSTGGTYTVNAAGQTVDINGATVTIDGSTAVNVGDGAVYTDGTNVVVNQASFTNTNYALEVKALDTITDTECILLTSNEGTPRSAGIEVGDGAPAHTVAAGTLYIRSASGTSGSLYIATDNAGTWAQVGTGAGNDLQAAYALGSTIDILVGVGNLEFQANTADFVVNDGTNAFLATDQANAQLELGSATNTVGFIGKVDTDVTFETSTAARTITGDGTNGLTVTSGAATALTLTSPVTATWSTTAGDLSISAAAVLDLNGGSTVTMDSATTTAITGGTGVTLQSTANNVEVTSAAVLDLNGGSTVTMDSATTTTITGGTGVTIASTANDIDISAAAELDLDGGSSVTMNSVTTTAIASTTTASLTGGTGLTLQSTANDVDISAAAELDLDSGTTLVATGATGVTISSTANNVEVTSAAVLDLNGGSTVTMDSATTTTITGGTGVTIASTANDVDILAAGALDLDATAGNVTIDAAATYDIVLTVAENAGSDISFTAHSQTLTLNSDTYKSFVGTNYLVDDTSIVEALIDLDTAVAANDAVISLPAGEAVGVIAAGDAVYVNTSGQVVRCDASALASSRFVGFAKDASVAVTTPMDIYVSGEVVVSTTLAGGNFVNGEYCFLSNATPGRLLADNDLSGLGVGDVIMRVGVVSSTANDKIVLLPGSPYTL